MATGRKGAGVEALYERYKDALKRGHVASLRGRLDEALEAYAEASSIAPERPAPHTSAGTALLRRRRPADALRCYQAALVLAPRDEAAMLGCAQSLAAMGRRREAAEAFDSLAAHRVVGGKLADAVDAARRGLELAEGRDRRRTLERLIDQLAASEGGEPGRHALERALRVLDGTALSVPRPVPAAAAASPEPGGGPEPESVVEPGPEPAAEPEPAVRVRGVLDRELPPGVATDTLALAADGALDAGDGPAAVERLLDLAAANRAAGQRSAAIDACYRALALDPDHVDLHLALVVLYDEQGWGALAVEKLDLLDRLAGLDDDTAAIGRIAGARAGLG